MEKMWLLYAVLAAVLAGIPAFILRVAAQREYNSKVFILIGAFVSLCILIPTSLLVCGVDSIDWSMLLIASIMGLFASLGSIFRIRALSCIDATIYFPLLKLFSPIVVITFGVTLFSESFTHTQWVGLFLGVLVPLLLITKKETSRQKKFLLGIILVVITGLISALVSVLGKYVSVHYKEVFWIVTAVSSGVFLGSMSLTVYRVGLTNIVRYINESSTRDFVVLASLRGLSVVIAYLCYIYSFVLNGPLVIVHTIHSLNILIPIVLSIIYYKEHWNLQKVSAIALSFVVLFLLR